MRSKPFTDFRVGDRVLLSPDQRSAFYPVSGRVIRCLEGGDYTVELEDGETSIYRGYQVERYSDERFACLLACMLRNIRKNGARFDAKLEQLGELSYAAKSAAVTAFCAEQLSAESKIRELGHDPNSV